MKTRKTTNLELFSNCASWSELLTVGDLRRQVKPYFTCKWLAYMVLSLASVIFLNRKYWKQQVPLDHPMVRLGTLKPYEIVSFGLSGMRPFWVHPTILHLVNIRLEDPSFVKEVLKAVKMAEEAENGYCAC